MTHRKKQVGDFDSPELVSMYFLGCMVMHLLVISGNLEAAQQVAITTLACYHLEVEGDPFGRLFTHPSEIEEH